MLLAICGVGLATLASPANAEPAAEPAEYRTNDYRAPVPATLTGAKVIDYEAAKMLLEAKSAVFIDVYPRAPKPANLPAGTVWRDPPHETIPGASWLANVGYGVLAPAVDTYFQERLATLSGGDKTKTLVFFCLRDCWMSWNAARRALSYGYSSVVWFPDGVDAWRDNEQAVVKVEPLP